MNHKKKGGDTNKNPDPAFITFIEMNAPPPSLFVRRLNKMN